MKDKRRTNRKQPRVTVKEKIRKSASRAASAVSGTTDALGSVLDTAVYTGSTVGDALGKAGDGFVTGLLNLSAEEETCVKQTEVTVFIVGTVATVFVLGALVYTLKPLLNAQSRNYGDEEGDTFAANARRYIKDYESKRVNLQQKFVVTAFDESARVYRSAAERVMSDLKGMTEQEIEVHLLRSCTKINGRVAGGPAYEEFLKGTFDSELRSLHFTPDIPANVGSFSAGTKHDWSVQELKTLLADHRTSGGLYEIILQKVKDKALFFYQTVAAKGKTPGWTKTKNSWFGVRVPTIQTGIPYVHHEGHHGVRLVKRNDLDEASSLEDIGAATEQAIVQMQSKGARKMAEFTKKISKMSIDGMTVGRREAFLKYVMGFTFPRRIIVYLVQRLSLLNLFERIANIGIWIMNPVGTLKGIVAFAKSIVAPNNTGWFSSFSERTLSMVNLLLTMLPMYLVTCLHDYIKTADDLFLGGLGTTIFRVVKNVVVKIVMLIFSITKYCSLWVSRQIAKGICRYRLSRKQMSTIPDAAVLDSMTNRALRGGGDNPYREGRIVMFPLPVVLLPWAKHIVALSARVKALALGGDKIDTNVLEYALALVRVMGEDRLVRFFQFSPTKRGRLLRRGMHQTLARAIHRELEKKSQTTLGQQVKCLASWE